MSFVLFISYTTIIQKPPNFEVNSQLTNRVISTFKVTALPLYFMIVHGEKQYKGIIHGVNDTKYIR